MTTTTTTATAYVQEGLPAFGKDLEGTQYIWSPSFVKVLVSNWSIWTLSLLHYSSKHHSKISLVTFKFWNEPKDLYLWHQTFFPSEWSLGPLGKRLVGRMVVMCFFLDMGGICMSTRLFNKAYGGRSVVFSQGAKIKETLNNFKIAFKLQWPSLNNNRGVGMLWSVVRLIKKQKKGGF